MADGRGDDARSPIRPAHRRVALGAADRWLLPIYVLGVTLYLVAAGRGHDRRSASTTRRAGPTCIWQRVLARRLARSARPARPAGGGPQQPGHRVLSTIVATILGTLIAPGAGPLRVPRPGRHQPAHLPADVDAGDRPRRLAADDVHRVDAAAVHPAGLVYPLSILTILIAHIMFNISFVVVTVKARLSGFPRHLEEAAMDLGANEWTTFWKVTFPLILPGIIAAALLAFSLSIDDYVITNFTSGQTQTFPSVIYGSPQRGIPVQVNVIGTIIFLVAVGFVAAHDPWQRRVAADEPRGRLTRRPPEDHAMVDTARRTGRRAAAPARPRRSCRPSGAGSRTSTSTAARARG